MRCIALAILLNGAVDCSEPPDAVTTLSADAGLRDARVARREFWFCPGETVPPDAGTLCTSSWFCKGLGQTSCAPPRVRECDAGACGLPTCEQAGDCECGSCVDRVCQPRPGICTGTAP
ncbi:MAG TPA: hypothetical protein VFX59_17185 [Polyangiales bacterium]|nr:hypothetical protein [Polyangiales bacterium]